MPKRKYSHIKILEPQIVAMREAGMTRREIADRLGLTKEQIKNWVRRYNKSQQDLAAGVLPRQKGRPRKKPLTSQEEYEKEIARLKMENELLRDFLYLSYCIPLSNFYPLRVQFLSYHFTIDYPPLCRIINT